MILNETSINNKGRNNGHVELREDHIFKLLINLKKLIHNKFN